MRQVSDAFVAAVTAEYQDVVFQADLWTAGLGSPLMLGLEVTGGSVTIDATAATRRTCTVNLADDTGLLLPLLTGSGGARPGPAELVLGRGLRFPTGGTEIVPLGVFRVSQVTVSDAPGPIFTVAGYDRSRTVARARFTSTYYIPAGGSYVSAAQALIDNRLPFTIPKVVTTSSATTVPSTIVFAEQDDPWQRVSELVGTVGAEAFFDIDGSLMVRDVGDPSGDPEVFAFAEGVTALFLSVDHVLDDEPGFNAAVVTGENSANTAAPPRALVYDADLNSPTYFFGPYGQVPFFINDPLATTTAQATSSATTQLRRTLGLTETVSLAVVPHPALDAGDTVRVRRAASGLDMAVQIQNVTVPLDVTTAMTLACRARRTG